MFPFGIPSSPKLACSPGWCCKRFTFTRLVHLEFWLIPLSGLAELFVFEKWCLQTLLPFIIGFGTHEDEARTLKFGDTLAEQATCIVLWRKSNYCATYIDAFWKMALDMWDAELLKSRYASLSSVLGGGDIEVRSVDVICVSLTSHTDSWCDFWLVTLSISLGFAEWVSDCFRGALSTHLVMACKNTISFHLAY